jgi:hypothetical protein
VQRESQSWLVQPRPFFHVLCGHYGGASGGASGRGCDDEILCGDAVSVKHRAVSKCRAGRQIVNTVDTPLLVGTAGTVDAMRWRWRTWSRPGHSFPRRPYRTYERQVQQGHHSHAQQGRRSFAKTNKCIRLVLNLGL